MTRLIQLVSNFFFNRQATTRLQDLPRRLRRDIGLPEDPGPPGMTGDYTRSWERYL
ncbi:hypothetical protein [Kiloniella laminariae]|uniref:hypothetical protein n=1 Tax=Kiloniella laminariae TaxID=454162 RepID=UPI00035CB0A0|nr:hypothetical protein [Kiloniella laminariae]